MAIGRKTAAQFASEIRTAITSRNNSYDVQVGPIPDLIINPMAAVLELQNERIRSVQQLLSLANDGSFTSEDIDTFVRNEGIVRLPGGRSRVVLTFFRATPPTVDLVVRANFPVGTLVDEATGTSVVFSTLADTTMFASLAASYFNPITQRYELPVTAIALASGENTNVAPHRVVRPLRPLVAFDGVTNPEPATGGRGEETDDELISRYFISLAGTTPTTPRGITKILRDLFPEVVDSLVVYGNNPLNLRSGTDSGAVDVYTIGDVLVSRTESVTFTGVGQVLPLQFQPVSSIASVTGYVQGVDYVLSLDTSPYGGSTRGKDGVYWLPTASPPAIGSSISVIYTYNTLQTTLQAAFNAEEYTAAGRDVLFKRATEVRVAITAQLRVASGFTAATIQSLVNDAILSELNGYLLGEDVEVSDIQAIARSFTSVDNFIITQCSKVGGTGVADIPIAVNEYARIVQSNLTITLI